MKKTIQVKLDEETISLIKKGAKAKGHTVSSFLRYIIRLYVKKIKGEK